MNRKVKLIALASLQDGEIIVMEKREYLFKDELFYYIDKKNDLTVVSTVTLNDLLKNDFKRKTKKYKW